MKKLSVYDNNVKRINIIGVPISVVNIDIVLSCIQNDLKEIRKRGDYICVSNVNTTVIAHNNANYLKVQKESYLSVPDGMPLVLIGKKVCKQIDRVAGLDLLKNIFLLSKSKKYKHYFYGNTKDNLLAFIEAVRHDYPWLDIVGFEPSVFRKLSSQEINEIASRINNSNADFVWVALGAPKQEIFCYEMKGKVHALMIGVGGVFNIIAGIIPDAPQWMKVRCLEWLYRLIKEPKRLFRRYLKTNFLFLYYFLKGAK